MTLDEALERAAVLSRTEPGRPDRFSPERACSTAVRAWLTQSSRVRNSQQLLAALNREVGAIDRVINDQVNAILHHPRFQRLEATWRGLDYLAGRPERESAAPMKVKVMNATWSELARDFDRAIDFDQSQLFRKIYENEFGSPGGEPFGALIGDYEIRPRTVEGDPHDDLDVLGSIAGVAAAAFCPFFANASPAMFELGENFVGLQRTLDHVHVLNQHAKWQALRNSEDARFVGLALPRVLMRLPYKPDSDRVDGFCFAEDVSDGCDHDRGPRETAAGDGLTHSKYLWAGAAFAVGAVIARAFEASGWPADIRGVQRGVETGGLVTGLPIDDVDTDSPGVVQKYTTDVVVTDRLERQLGDSGFIPLCHCHDAPFAAFYSVPSIQKPRGVGQSAADANARLSSMMQYVLCVSRFAHYIKVMARDRLGGVTGSEQLERVLQDWVTKYVVHDDDASPEVKARYPLREARVQIVAKPGAAGSHHCVMHLVPHYQLDDMAVKVRLTTEIAPLSAH